MFTPQIRYSVISDNLRQLDRSALRLRELRESHISDAAHLFTDRLDTLAQQHVSAADAWRTALEDAHRLGAHRLADEWDRSAFCRLLSARLGAARMRGLLSLLPAAAPVCRVALLPHPVFAEALGRLPLPANTERVFARDMGEICRMAAAEADTACLLPLFSEEGEPLFRTYKLAQAEGLFLCGIAHTGEGEGLCGLFSCGPLPDICAAASFILYPEGEMTEMAALCISTQKEETVLNPVPLRRENRTDVRLMLSVPDEAALTNCLLRCLLFFPSVRIAGLCPVPELL